MPQLSGMVLEGQDPETRIQNVIDGASWIVEADQSLVDQGKQEILNKISNDSWVPPFTWSMTWINIPPQEAQQELRTEILSA